MNITSANIFANGSPEHRPARRGWLKTVAFATTIVAFLARAAFAQSAPATLDDISFTTLPGDRIQLKLDLSQPVPEPLSFATDDPARIALDFPGVGLNVPRKNQTIGVGMARSVAAVEAGGRTRVVLNLLRLVPYESRVSGDKVFITLNASQDSTPAESRLITSAQDIGQPGGNLIENVDFRRGERGEGRVVVTLSDPSTAVDTRQEGSKVIVRFFGARLPEELARRLDVVDFATPVASVDASQSGKDVRLVINAKGNYDHVAYQSDNVFSVDIKAISKAEQKEIAKKKFGYTGEKLSLNFQNIEVRAVLQLIADFTGLNLVASDTVGGTLTLRLKNVPWDQALDIILKTRGLAMRQSGNVILVAPSEELAARERQELEAQRQVEELAPLRSEFVQVNYAKASDIATLLKTDGNSLMSERGNVAVDDRTNTLLVRDTADAIDAIRKMVMKLDVPVRQVLIESRIVIADDNFNRDLGVKFGFSQSGRYNEDNQYFVGGKRPGDTDFGGNVAFNTNDLENFIVDLPIGNPAGALGLAIVAIPDTLLQLELQAMQTEGRGEVISNPRVVTSDQREAVIEQGTEIPFQEASSSGATSTSFKKAVLSLKVTPQITPDDRVIMDLAVNQDQVGQEFSGVPSVNTRSVDTQVLVDNGETVVLGGIFEQITRDDTTKVPFFGDLPYLGPLFRQNSLRDEKTELLIFVTPKILKETLTGRGG